MSPRVEDSTRRRENDQKLLLAPLLLLLALTAQSATALADSDYPPPAILIDCAKVSSLPIKQPEHLGAEYKYLPYDYKVGLNPDPRERDSKPPEFQLKFIADKKSASNNLSASLTSRWGVCLEEATLFSGKETVVKDGVRLLKVRNSTNTTTEIPFIKEPTILDKLRSDGKGGSLEDSITFSAIKRDSSDRSTPDLSITIANGEDTLTVGSRDVEIDFASGEHRWMLMNVYNMHSAYPPGSDGNEVRRVLMELPFSWDDTSPAITPTRNPQTVLTPMSPNPKLTPTPTPQLNLRPERTTIYFPEFIKGVSRKKH